ncbi:hypothetical protein MWU75_14750, partial [Ornithinimicrobium sp. F0845]|uniref:hypothetical protein n=1 Tax=Ornithinimicrobium sp. F0845 TaxID=2926412 RepID=UPI001FF5DC0B
NHRREMTWQTLLGKIYKTKAHDYTQYSTMLTEATDQVLAADQEDRREAIDLAIYQALSYKPGGTARLITGEDEPYGETQFLSWNQIRLTRRNPKTGRKLNEPDPEAVKRERARHTRAAQDPDDDTGSSAADSSAAGSSAAGSTTPTSTDTPGHGPWATPDDTPPPF